MTVWALKLNPGVYLMIGWPWWHLAIGSYVTKIELCAYMYVGHLHLHFSQWLHDDSACSKFARSLAIIRLRPDLSYEPQSASLICLYKVIQFHCMWFTIWLTRQIGHSYCQKFMLMWNSLVLELNCVVRMFWFDCATYFYFCCLFLLARLSGSSLEYKF